MRAAKHADHPAQHAAFVALFAALCVATTAGAQPTMTDPRLEVTTFATGLTLPTGFGFIGPNDLLAIEKDSGRVKRIANGVITSTVLDLNVSHHSERGLLGIAVHPDFDTNHFVYLYYSASGTGVDSFDDWSENRLARFTWDGAVLGSETVVLSIPHDPLQLNGPGHNGGPLAFGPDGKLYGTTGDLFRDRAEQNNQSQPLTSSGTGGIYRLNAPGDGTDGSVPSDNPFFTNPNGGFRKWYAYGVRNTFGIGFDPLTGNLWATENGRDVFDEINLVFSGFNSGWTPIIGPEDRDPDGVGDLVMLPNAQYGDPAFTFRKPIGITTIQFLAGSVLGANYVDSVFVGDNNTGQLYMFHLNANRDGFVFSDAALQDLLANNETQRDLLAVGSGFDVITDIEIGPAGDRGVYVMSFRNGEIYRIAPEPHAAVVYALAVLLCARRRRRLGAPDI